MPTEDELRQGFRLGEWEVLPLRGVLRKGDQEEKPEPRVFGVLLALAQRDGDLVTRDELVDELWAGRPTSDEPINRCLSQLRGHLGDKSRPHTYVETLTRRGYRLLQPVELLHPAGSQPESGSERGSPRQIQWWRALTGFLAVGALAWLVWTQLPPGEFKSIGVLPFENASKDPANDYLVAGFKDELVHTLHNIPNLTVKSSHNAREDQEAKDIARDFGVDVILTGRVHRVDDVLQIFYSVEDGRSGDVIASAELEGPVDEIFRLQEELAKRVRDDLLGSSTRQLITRTRPANFKAYDRYMRGLYAIDKRQDSSSLEEAIGLFQETIRRDEYFGPAYVMLATAYALLPAYRDAPDAELYRLAIETAQQGVAVDKSIEDAANAVFGYVYHKEMDWLRSEDAYKAATAADIVDPNAFNWYSRMLASVGRLDESLVQARIAVEMDPTSAVLNSRMALAHLWLGDVENAGEYFARAERYGATGPTHMMGYAFHLFQQGRIEDAYVVTQQASAAVGGASDWIDPVFAALDDPVHQPQALAAIDSAAENDAVSKQIEFIVRTVLGDIDGAMDVARLLENHGEVFEMDLLFIPQAQAFREHPEFMDLMESLGISRYWYENRCRWTASGVDCDDA